MTPQELKNSILQLAIQGKLVEQRAEEGTGRESLEKILAAKNAEGAKGKGEKSHAKSAKSAKAGSCVSREEIPDDEKPFDIPESWEWVRLGECSSYAEKKEKIIPSEIKPDDWSLDLEDIEKDTSRIIEFRLARDRRITGDKVVFRKGQILYSKLRPYLKKILIAPNDGICTPELVPFSALGGIDARYLVVVLKSPHVDFVINSVTYGVKMPRVGTETMVSLPIPLPPLAEQKRIVAKIEELMPLVDRYEKAWSKLEDFNKRFPADMQKSLLQMAIQGKLVEQRAEEGTGRELLEEILAAKNAESAKGKGEKSHAKSAKSAKVGSRVSREEISDDEKPFDLPESWVWAKLKDLGEIVTGATPKKSESDLYGGQYPFYKPAELDQGYNVTHAKETLSDVGWGKARRLSVGSVLVTCIGATIGKTGIIRREGTCNQQINAIIPCEVVSEYLYYVIISTWFQTSLKAEASRTTLPIMNKSKFENLMIPLPPFAEQKRIVAKLEELLPLCERLK